MGVVEGLCHTIIIRSLRTVRYPGALYTVVHDQAVVQTSL